jgi:hypothetical protein
MELITDVGSRGDEGYSCRTKGRTSAPAEKSQGLGVAGILSNWASIFIPMTLING